MILSLDTSDFISHVCVQKVDGEAHAYSADTEGNAERLLASIHSLLERCGADFSEVERILLCLGPGSFTGIRTGIATVQGLAAPREIEVFGCSLLLAGALRAAQSDESLADKEYRVLRRANKTEYFEGRYHLARTEKASGITILGSSGVSIVPRDDLLKANAVDADAIYEVPCHRYEPEFKAIAGNPAEFLSACFSVLQEIPLGSEYQISPGAAGLTGLYTKEINAKTLAERGLR